MRIEKIEIKNYRTLDGVKVHFNLESNYIVGENNIGKSNFLEMINIISMAGSFSERDFTDFTKPIVINLSLKFHEYEQGVFGGSFTPTDPSIINITVIQDIKDAYPQVINSDTTETVHAKNLRKINFLKYDTNVNPNNKLGFDKSELYLKKIKAFDQFDVSNAAIDDSSDIFSKLIYLMEGKQFSISNTGNGLQFVAMASLNVFSKILDLYKSKSTPFEDSLFITKEGKRILPLILAIDEPEVHLHPYMQRAILNYYKRILKNDEKDFLDLLKYSFDIDGLDGQLIVVTHSTDALIDNHRNIIRLYKSKDGGTNAISGMDMNFRSDLEKHLLMHFSDLKEAFYSKCVLIVEGDTEYGCIRGFSKTLNISMDDYGICFVNAQGEGSIPKLKQLFNYFSIPSIVIYDSDVKEGKIADENEFFTKEVCFEMDIVDKLIEMKQFETIQNIALELNSNANSHMLEANFMRKPFKKIEYDLESYVPKTLAQLDIQQIEEYRAVYYAWYYSKKGILIGKIIGNTLSADCIPTCYIDAIYKAREVALL